MRRRDFGRWAGTTAGAVSSVGLVGSVSASPAAQGVASGAVVKVQGTKHVFIADEAGVLHWGGDSRALSGRVLDWGSVMELPPSTVLTMRRGDPWLSAGLVKDGAPIYLAKWEADWSQPTLQHILSIRDVEAFGISERNYGTFVLDRSEWERRYGFSVAFLTREALDAFAPQGAPALPRLRLGETWRGAGLTLTLVEAPGHRGGSLHAIFDVVSTSNRVLNFEVRPQQFVLETNTGRRWVTNRSESLIFDNVRTGDRRRFEAWFEGEHTAAEFTAALRDPGTTYWEISVRGFSPRLPEAYWREPVNH